MSKFVRKKRSYQMRKFINGRQSWVCILLSFSLFFAPTSCSIIKIPKPEITEVPWDFSMGFERTAGEGPLGYKIGILSTGAMTFETTYFYGDTKFRQIPSNVTKILTAANARPSRPIIQAPSFS
jgi:hypothetical protein